MGKFMNSRFMYVFLIVFTIAAITFTAYALPKYLDGVAREQSKWDQVISDPKASTAEIDSAKRVIQHMEWLKYSSVALYTLSPLLLAGLCVLLTIQRRREASKSRR